jgi:DNA-binding XRE family transcriptional regulator
MAAVLYHNMNISSRKDVKRMGIKITLAAARVNAGLTQKEAAKALCVSNKTLGAWESGKSSPKAKYVVTLCELYGVQYDNIFFGN